MTAVFPEAVPTGGWTVAPGSETGDAVVVWQPGDEPAQPQVRGMLLYRWLCSLRDAGFTCEACTDMAVFGRPEQESPDGIARYLRITAWSKPPAAVAAPLPPLPPKPLHRDVALPPGLARELRCPLTGVTPSEVRFTYRAAGVEMTLVYETADLHWGAAVPVPPVWLQELAEQHRPQGGGSR